MESAILLTAEPLSPFVDRWRREASTTDDPRIPLAEAVPPHITLLWPWHPDPSSDSPRQRLREAVIAVHPFQLRFRTVKLFDDGLVCLLPDPSSGLDALFAGLVEAFPDFPPYGGQFEEVVLHLTLAPRGGEAVATQVRDQDPDLRLDVEAISTWQATGSGRWKLCERFPLGRTAD